MKPIAMRSAEDQQKTATFRADCDGEDGNPVVDEVEVLIVGGWYQVNGEFCPDFCASVGKVNVASKDGSMCTSGESIPPSAVGIIDFDRGCWPSGSCPAQGRYLNNTSDNGDCYGPGQKKDDDGTDVTMGCYCK